MKLTQVKGNTWVAEGEALIPFYRLEDGRCILLDSGYTTERQVLEQALLDAGLIPAAILSTHTHIDHAANHAYFQRKYHLPVALTASEAGLCASLLNLKYYVGVISPAITDREMWDMPLTADILLPDGDSQPELLGVPFRCIYTPGHSPGHICIITPDNVCYVGDTLLSRELLYAKLPYACDHDLDLVTKERLRGLDCDVYIAAHRGVFTDIDAIIDANRDLILQRAEEILSVIDQPMHMSQISLNVSRLFSLNPGTARRALSFERNIRFFVEYLLDRGDLVLELHDGVAYFAPTRR